MLFIMNGEQLSVKWSNFQSTIVAAFESLQSTEDLADVTLTCEGLNVKAHKVILSACSPYFRTVFRENPCSHPIVILKDVLYTDMLAILKFMYHGEVLLHKDQLSTFLQTAEVLQVSGLMGRSQHGVGLNIASAHSTSQVHGLPNDNAAVLRAFSGRSSLQSLHGTRQIAAKNTREIPHTQSSPQKRAKVGAVRARVPQKPTSVTHAVPPTINTATALDSRLKTEEQDRERDKSDRSDYSDNSENNNEPPDPEAEKAEKCEQITVPSLLEAALESNSNGGSVSILERSLKSLGKPMAPVASTPAQTSPSSATVTSPIPLPVAAPTDTINKIEDNMTISNTVLIKTELVDDMSAEEESHCEDNAIDDREADYTVATEEGEDDDDDDLEGDLHLREPSSLVETVVTVLGSGDSRGGGSTYGQPHLAAHTQHTQQQQQHHSSQCGNCPHCGKTYSNQSALKYHVRLVHSDMLNLYCCHLCPLTFDYRDGYKRHMVDVHNFRN